MNTDKSRFSVLLVTRVTNPTHLIGCLKRNDSNETGAFLKGSEIFNKKGAAPFLYAAAKRNKDMTLGKKSNQIKKKPTT